MRSSPHVVFWRHIRRIRLRRSESTGGRPDGRRDRQRQRMRHPARCQPMTVSGLTSRTTSAKRRKRPASPPISHRSKRRNRGRFSRRRATMSCWRRSKFSVISTARGATESEDHVKQEAKDGGHDCLTASLPRWPPGTRQSLTTALPPGQSLITALPPRHLPPDCTELLRRTAGRSVRGGLGSGAAMATSPSAKPEQIQLTTEYLRPTAFPNGSRASKNRSRISRVPPAGAASGGPELPSRMETAECHPSQLRAQQADYEVGESSHPTASTPALEGDRAGLGAVALEYGGQRLRDTGVQQVQVHLVVEAKRATVEVGRADRAPQSVHDHHLAVKHRGLILEDLDPRFQQWPPAAPGGVAREGGVYLIARNQDLHLHAALPGRHQHGHGQVVRDEIGVRYQDASSRRGD